MNLYDIDEIKKRPDIPKVIKYIYKNEENKTKNESTITDRITNALENNLLLKTLIT